jgi:hypothetical protein
MSNANAIAAVTGKLRDMLAEKSGLGSQSIATEPLDQIAGLGAGKRLNLYLYQILPNAHWRNGNIPWRTRNGEAAPAPLALDLRYLLTATSRKQVDAQGHLGAGMRALHDNPVLYPGDPVHDPEGAAVRPFERARITLHPLSIEEMERLWMGVPAPRLLSVAYDVSVVLIESAKPATLPLPVLRRVIEVEPSIQFAAIERIEVGNTQLAFDQWLKAHGRAARTVAQIGDEVRIYGSGLGDAKRVLLSSLMHDEVIPLKFTPSRAADGATKIVLDAQEFQGKGFPAGLCSIVVVLSEDAQQNPLRMTNAAPLALAPTIDFTPKELTAPGRLTVSVDPPTVAGQKISLILGDLEIPQSAGGSSTSLPFDVPRNYPRWDKVTQSNVGKHRVCLRVDGVDSIVIDLKTFDAQAHPFTDPLVVN